MKQKLRVFCTLLLLAVASVGWGNVLYSTSFDETGYATSTTYNNKVEVLQGPADGFQWATYYGTTSTDGALSGNNSLQCRYYASANTVEPYVRMNFDVANANSISFKSKVGNVNLYLLLQYSTDEGDTWQDAQTYDLTTTTNDYTYTFSSQQEKVRFKFVVKHKNTISSGNQKFWLDDVVIVDDATVDPSVATTTTIDASGITNTDVYSGTEAGQLTASVVANDIPVQGAVVTWNSGNTDVATIDADGNVTLVAEGKTIITAYYAGVENQYKPSEDSYELTVTDSTPFSGGDVTFIAGTDVGTTTVNNSPDQVTKNGVTISATDAAFATAEYRFYKNSETTISVSEGVITKIVFTGVSGNPASGFATQDGWTTDGSNGTWTGSAQSVSFTASGAQVRATKIVVTVDLNAAPVPVINASDVNITYDATGGNIEFTIDNPIASTSLTAVVKDGSWLVLGNVTGNLVPFTCDANTESVARTAVVTLTYGDVTKDVTVTQAAAPAALKTIAEVREQGTGNVTTKGVVTSCVGRNAYIQDATAAILVYGNSTITDLTVGDEIKVSGTLSTYHGLLEITNPEYTVLTRENTVEPEVMTIAQVIENASNKQGWLVKIENATVTAIDEQNPTIAQGEESIVVRHIASVEYNVGDILTLTGNIGCYDNVQIANPQNVSVQKTTSITAVDAVDLAADAISGEIAYEINNPIDGTILEASTSADWISNIRVETDKVTFTTTANTGAERTSTITLTYGDVTKEVTVTQAAYIAPITGDKYVKVTSTSDLTNGQYLIVYEEGSVAFNGGLETLDAVGNTIEVIFNNNEIAATNATAAAEFTIDVTAGTLKSASAKYIGVSSNTNGLKQTDNADTYTHTFSIDNNGNAAVNAVFEGSTMALRYNKTSGQTRFRYFKNAGQEAIQLYKKVGETPQPETITVTISDKAIGNDNYYYGTLYYGECNLVVPEGIVAYTYTVENGKMKENHSYEAEDVIPAGTGVLLKTETATEYQFTVTTDPGVEDDDNYLFGSDIDAQTNAGEGDWKYYKLITKGGKDLGFYFGVEDGAPFTNGAHKAYLAVPAGQAPAKGFVLGEETDGINAIDNSQQQIVEGIYNLAGQRVNKAQKGIYIVNGKKVVVK